MLFIEYDVDDDGVIELVALINAVEEGGEDPDGTAWMAWRSAMEDGGDGLRRGPRTGPGGDGGDRGP